jgi:dienelactone hydrolase
MGTPGLNAAREILGHRRVRARIARLKTCLGSVSSRVPLARTRREMAEVLLFHHAQGLTPGVVAFADELRRAGHTVHAPGFYDGRTFDTLDEGMAYAREIGFDEVFERGVRAADGLPASLSTPASRSE